MELCAYMTVRHAEHLMPSPPIRQTFATSRFGEPLDVQAVHTTVTPERLENATRTLARGDLRDGR